MTCIKIISFPQQLYLIALNLEINYIVLFYKQNWLFCKKKENDKQGKDK